MGGGIDPIRVLHVDDDPDFLDLTATFLERDEDLVVVTETSASDGFDRYVEDRVDCIVSDYDMPGRNGIEFLETVREEDERVPFILFTGKGSEQVASDAISAGVTDYIEKGTGAATYDILANQIRNAVEKHRVKRRLERQRQQYKSLFDEAPIMFALFEDRDGEPVITDCNRRFAERLGYGRGDVLGQSIRAFYTDESVERAIEGNGFDRALDGEFSTERRELVAEDGEVIRTIVRPVPRADEFGHSIGTAALYVAITDRLESEN